MSDYRFERIDTTPASLEAIASLLSYTFQKPSLFTTAYITWLYKHNPDGEVIGYNAYAPDGTLAGHYCVIPIQCQLHNQALKAALSLNTATHPQHQGKQLFTQLARLTFEAAASSGVRMIMGVANQNSIHGAEKKLGYQRIGMLDVALGPNIPVWPEPVAIGFQRSWNATNLRWRLNNPVATYRSRTTADRCSVVAPSGYPFIEASLGTFSGDVLTTPLPAASSRLLQPFQLWMGLHPAIQKAPRGFYSLPLRWRRSPLFLMMKDLSGTLVLPPAEEILFCPLDFDAF
jgi:hypothetical protein